MIKSKLKQLLAGMGLQNKDLCEALGVNEATVSRWCSNGVPLGSMSDVCFYLRCQPGDLYSYTPDYSEQVATVLVDMFAGVMGGEIRLQSPNGATQLLLTANVIEFDGVSGYKINKNGKALIEASPIVKKQFTNAVCIDPAALLKPKGEE